MALMSIREIAYAIGGLSIIDSISFDVENGEFISLIGPSGCGKSTMLRIIAGLIKPLRGTVMYNGKEITGPIKEISFVFQDFGLLPWLTNIENVKLGLTRFNLSDEEKTRRAKELFKKFGLEGFENTYPNMLSGGMKQRVGVARAVISQPKVLLMDEPFSSLDELTADTLRKDLLRMLKDKNSPVSSVIMVTHNVEEAVELSDKVVVLSDRPSRVKEIKKIDLKYPRDRHTKEFMSMVDYIYRALTG